MQSVSITTNVRTLLRRGVFYTTLCDKVCQWLATDLWFSSGTPVSSTNKNDRHNITEILLKVALNLINPNPDRSVLMTSAIPYNYNYIPDILNGMNTCLPVSGWIIACNINTHCFHLVCYLWIPILRFGLI